MKKLFSIIGVAGALIACQPQDLSTSFKPQPATVEITFVVKDINGGIDIPSREGEKLAINPIPDNSGKVIITPDGDKKFKITGTENYPKIDAGEFTFDFAWTYQAEDGGKMVPKTTNDKKSVKVNGLLAGGQAKYTVNILLGTVGGFDVRSVEIEKETKTHTGNLLPNDHRHAYTHDGTSPWYYNETEYVLAINVNWTTFNGTDVVEGSRKMEPGFAGVTM